MLFICAPINTDDESFVDISVAVSRHNYLQFSVFIERVGQREPSHGRRIHLQMENERHREADGFVRFKER